MKVFLCIAASLLLMTSGAFAQSDAEPSAAVTSRPRSRSPIDTTPKNGPRSPRAPTALPTFRPKPTKEPFVRPKRPTPSATAPSVIFPTKAPAIDENFVTSAPSLDVTTSAPSLDVTTSAPSVVVTTSAPSVVVETSAPTVDGTSAPSTATVTTAPSIQEDESLVPETEDDETDSPDTPSDLFVQMVVEASSRRPNSSPTMRRGGSKSPSTVKAPSRPRSPSRPRASPRSGPSKANSRTGPKSPIVKSPSAKAAGRRAKSVAPTTATI